MIWQMIEDWFRGILTDGILSNLSGLFDSVNTEVGEIATQVGTTPAGFGATSGGGQQTGQQGDQGDADEGNTAASHELFHPQLGVKTLLDGGRRRTKNLYGVVKRTVPAGQVRQ